MNNRCAVYLLFLFSHIICSETTKITQSRPVKKVSLGGDAQKGEFPYVVAIRTISDKEIFCCGTLIHRQWILTALHCLRRGKSLLITMNTDNEYNVTNKKAYFVNKTIAFGIGRPPDHDVALIRLNRPANEMAVYPIKLIDNPSHQKIGTEVTIVGWGFTEKYDTPKILQAGSTYILKDEICAKRYPTSFKGDKYLCGGLETGIGCYGDSGGPLVVKSSNNSRDDILVGITIFHHPICTIGGPTGFSKIYTLRQSIIKSLKIYGDKLLNKDD